jgi:oligopeptide/dipeptide ABC transporter ATP-binding protein
VRLAEIPGMVPSPIESIGGCRFAARCPLASEQCRTADPALEEAAPGHYAACWHSDRATELVNA